MVEPQMRALGVDVGGTAIKFGRVSPHGDLQDTRQVPTPKDPHALADVVARQWERTPADRIGLVTPGIVDDDAGVVRYSANLDWHDLPLRDLVADRIGHEVSFGHDVRAGALAESRWGTGAPDMIFLPLGTGMAAGLILEGRIRGTGWAGEVGQIYVQDPDGSGRLPLEQVAAAGALARRYAALTGSTDISAGARGVLERLAAGDRTAAWVFDSAMAVLAGMIADLAGLLGPIPIVIGGGLAEAGEQLFGPLQQALADRMTAAAIPSLRRAELGQWAGCLGAAALTLPSGGTP